MRAPYPAVLHSAAQRAGRKPTTDPHTADSPLKVLNNPAVQGVVAVSDTTQLEKIRSEVAARSNLKDKLKYWNYTEVLEVHDALESVNEAIHSLGLVPRGF